MARKPDTTTTTTTTVRREHISSEPAVYRRFRGHMLTHDNPLQAVSVGAAYRIEREDLILPHHELLARLTDENERAEYTRSHRHALDVETRALAELERREARGHNNITRASELAAMQAQREENAAAMVARTAELADELLAREDAARVARIQAAAAAMAQAEKGRQR